MRTRVGKMGDVPADIEFVIMREASFSSTLYDQSHTDYAWYIDCYSTQEEWEDAIKESVASNARYGRSGFIPLKVKRPVVSTSIQIESP